MWIINDNIIINDNENMKILIQWLIIIVIMINEIICVCND